MLFYTLVGICVSHLITYVRSYWPLLFSVSGVIDRVKSIIHFHDFEHSHFGHFNFNEMSNCGHNTMQSVSHPHSNDWSEWHWFLCALLVYDTFTSTCWTSCQKNWWGKCLYHHELVQKYTTTLTSSPPSPFSFDGFNITTYVRSWEVVVHGLYCHVATTLLRPYRKKKLSLLPILNLKLNSKHIVPINFLFLSPIYSGSLPPFQISRYPIEPFVLEDKFRCGKFPSIKWTH